MPYVPQDILDEIKQMQNDIRQLQGRVNIRPAQNKILAGDVTVGTGGTFKVNNLVGGPAFYVGGISPANPDGSPQRGMLIYRQDGTLALSVANATSNPADPQAVVVKDARGGTLLAEDVVAGGLAWPTIPMLAPQDVTVARWPQTTATSWTTIASSTHVKTQPVLRVFTSVTADVGSTGQIRYLLNGAAFGPVGNSVGSLDYSGPVPVAIASQFTLDVQAQRTSGAGAVYAQTFLMYGAGS